MSSEPLLLDRQRLRWRCRRGLLELDLILARFLERQFPTLDGEQRAAFAQLLERPDNDLLDLALGKLEAAGDMERAVVGLLRQV